LKKEDTMELLDRYLQAVKKHLPWKRQDDILAELRANMESQLEDKENELGRPLTQGEMEDWLRTMGSPVMVASRYQPVQYLIGPTFFPMYLYVLRLALLWALLIYTIVNAVVIPFSAPTSASVIDIVLRVPGFLISVAGWVTLVFAALEFVATRYPEKCPSIAGLSGAWSPSSLPALEKGNEGFGKPRSYTQAVAEVVFGFIALVWMLLIPKHPFLLFGPGAAYLAASPFRPAENWWTFFWWIVALNVVQLAWRSVNLLRGAWQKRSSTENLVVKIMGLIPLILLLRVPAGGYLLLKNPAEQAHYGSLLASINEGIHLALTVVCVIVVLTLAWDIGQFILNTYRQRSAVR
jgi:hypothetical protein